MNTDGISDPNVYLPLIPPQQGIWMMLSHVNSYLMVRRHYEFKYFFGLSNMHHSLWFLYVNMYFSSFSYKQKKGLSNYLFLNVYSPGNFEVGVHIADVSYFLKEGTILDKIAGHRATSVYLVQKVCHNDCKSLF